MKKFRYILLFFVFILELCFDLGQSSQTAAPEKEEEDFFGSDKFVGLMIGLGSFAGLLVLCCILWKCCCGGKDD